TSNDGCSYETGGPYFAVAELGDVLLQPGRRRVVVLASNSNNLRVTLAVLSTLAILALLIAGGRAATALSRPQAGQGDLASESRAAPIPARLPPSASASMRAAAASAYAPYPPHALDCGPD